MKASRRLVVGAAERVSRSDIYIRIGRSDKLYFLCPDALVRRRE